MQHRVNDTAVLDATVTALETKGGDAVKTSEREVEQGRLPVAELYLNMCQGSLGRAAHAAGVRWRRGREPAVERAQLPPPPPGKAARRELAGVSPYPHPRQLR